MSPDLGDILRVRIHIRNGDGLTRRDCRVDGRHT